MVKSTRIKLAMGARQYARLMQAVSRMVSGEGKAALSAMRQGGPVPADVQGRLAGAGTSSLWRDLAQNLGSESTLRDRTFRLIPRSGPDDVQRLTAMPGDWGRQGRPASFQAFLEQRKTQPLRATGWGPEGFVTPSDLATKQKPPVPPLWDPADRAIRGGDLDVARGEFLQQNPRSRYTRRPEQDLATVLHMPKGGMFLPPGAKRGGIPFSHEINPYNERDLLGAGRGAYLFRGGGVNASPDDHVFLSGNAAVAKHYSSGVAGMQAQRNNARRTDNSGGWRGVPTARPETRLPTPRLLQWFRSSVARTPAGQQLPTRRHSEGILGTKGVPYAAVQNMSRVDVPPAHLLEPHYAMEHLPSYQVDFPARNLGRQQAQVPRGFGNILGGEQVAKFGLRPYENAAGWAYDTPQGTYVMRGREAFEKDFHTRDGRAFMRATGKTPPRNQPLPLPMYDASTEPYRQIRKLYE